MALLKVKVNEGMLEGVPGGDQRISVFKGIPYAKPPIGKLRWAAPEPPEKWIGVRKADTFRDIAMQTYESSGFYFREFYYVRWPRSEDCLYLNIWTPAQSADEKLPVAIWLHGGKMQQGYSQKPEIDGEAFARRGVIFISINYRIGVFGFLATPELTAESSQRSSGNYGIMDQIAALNWVRQNIASFGGDPDNITVFGQSAGGRSTQAFVSSPLSKNHIKKAIMMSAGGMGDAPSLPKYNNDDACKAGMEFLKFAGCSNITEAREIDAEKLQDLYDCYSGKPPYERTNVDGYIIPEDLLTVFRKGRHSDIQYMVGTTKEETYKNVLNGKQNIPKAIVAGKKCYPGHEDEYLKLMHVDDEEAFRYMNAELAIQGRLAPLTAFSEQQLRLHRRPVYQYVFAHAAPPVEEGYGAFHSSEHMYIHQTLLHSWRPYTPEDFKVSFMMCAYWTNFIKTGDPNGDGLAKWSPFTETNRKVMYLDTTCSMIDPPLTDLGRFIKNYALGDLDI